ncbi:FAD-binding domain-containing protein [Hypoxylon sp. NC0597]|nr:FAD-binding domain-containing protein [Hypoxylon sp. NC0597]
MTDFTVLKQKLATGQVLEPGTSEYSKAVFIGNLNYRMTMPALVVQARSVKDVENTNGGHSYMGYCLNEGGIVLDLSGMKACSIDKGKMTVTMEGGATWKDVYNKFKDPTLIAIGGQCPGVGVSGFTLGGGISPFSRQYGLGCDNVLEMTIVTYEGKVVTVSKNEQDEKRRGLFWALCGGGGGNFGVTVKMTCNIHKLKDPNGTVVCGEISWNLPQQKGDFDKAVEAFNKSKCPEDLTIDMIWSHGKKSQLTGGMTVIYNGGLDAAKKAIKYLLDLKPALHNLEPMKWTDWVRKSEGWEPFSQAYHHHASFIFAEGKITQELNTKISDIVAEASRLVGITDQDGPDDPKCFFLWDHMGAATSRLDARATPFYWRQGHYASEIKLLWKNPDQGPKMMAFFVKCYKVLGPYAIEQKAAYLNYIDGGINNWQEAYYGKNYHRLQVKTEWDPKNFFRNLQSIQPLSQDSTSYDKDIVLPVSEGVEGSEQPQIKKVEALWEKYAPLATPTLLGSPKTEEEVYKRDAEIRREILNE